MLRQVIFALFLAIVQVTSFHVPFMTARFSSLTSKTTLRMSTPSETPATPVPEFVGAKKFSMKDRYTNTVLSSE